MLMHRSDWTVAAAKITVIRSTRCVLAARMKRIYLTAGPPNAIDEANCPIAI